MKDGGYALDGIVVMVLLFVAAILFYYLAIPPILRFISAVEQFLSSPQFLIGVIVGAVIVLFIVSYTSKKTGIFA